MTVERFCLSVLVLLASEACGGAEEGRPKSATRVPTAAVKAVRERRVPHDVRGRFDRKPADVLRSFSLKAVRTSTAWESARGFVQAAGGEVRSFAVLDVLFPGAVVVALRSREMDLFLGTGKIVTIDDRGAFSVREDFRTANERAIVRIPRFRGDVRGDERILSTWVDDLKSSDPVHVQKVIDRLIAFGELALVVLASSVTNSERLEQVEYAFPSGSDKTAVPRVLGDTCIFILEAVTGEHFGDPTGNSSSERRENIAKSWTDFAGVVDVSVEDARLHDLPGDAAPEH